MAVFTKYLFFSFIFSSLLCAVNVAQAKASDTGSQKYDTVFVTGFGIQPDNRINAVPAVQAALEVCRSKANPLLIFPEGRYDFWPQHAIEKIYYESNTTDNNPKRNAILINAFRKLTIDGNGSSFVYHDRIQPFTVDHSSNVVIRNVTIDWDIPLTAQAEVLDTTQNYVDIRIDAKQYPYIIENQKLVFVGEGWKSNIRGIIEYEKSSHLIAYRTGDVPGALGRNWRNYKAEELKQEVVRLYNNFQRKPKPGNILILRHSARDHAMMFIVHSKNVSIERVTGYHCAGLGILSQYSEDLSFKQVHIIPNSAKGRYFSGHDDGLHFSNCKGRILVDSCSFDGLMDDPINIHGTYVKVMKKLSENKLLCRFLESMSVGMEWARTGEQVAFINNKSLATIGKGEVISFKPISTTDFEIEFVDNIPEGVNTGSGLENLTWTPSATIQNSLFASNRARGILVTTPKKVVIENNIFKSSGSAILIAGDVNSWFESGAVKDILIRNNQFLSSCNTSDYQFTKAVISIFPEIPVMSEKTPPYHKNIRIEGNKFYAFDYPVLFAQSVSNLKFENNKLFRSYDFKPYHPEKVTFSLSGCRMVSIKNNTIDKNLLGRNVKLEFMEKSDVDLQKGLVFEKIVEQ